LLVVNSDNLGDIGTGLATMFYIGAGVTTVLFILILIGKWWHLQPSPVLHMLLIVYVRSVIGTICMDVQHNL